MKTRYRNIAVSIIAVLVVVIAFSGVVDAPGQRYVDEGFKRALIAFAVARGLNGVISVAQGTEVAVQPAGVGVKLAPGEILDPLNDLVEQFSWVMLASSASLGIQKILLNISAAWGFSLLAAIMLGIWLICRWYPPWSGRRIAGILGRVALMLIVLRFIVPVMALASEGVYRLFLEQEYQQSLTALETTVDRLDQINDAATPPLADSQDQSLLDKARRAYDVAAESLDFKARFERYKTAATDASEQAIRLIVVFVLQTVLLPLLFLWLMLQMIKRVARIRRPVE